MNNKEYRELQLTSSQLVFIFLAIIILGIIIFLLGVSTGKKQAQIARSSEAPAETLTEKVEPERPQTASATEDSLSKELASHQKAKEEAKPQTPLSVQQQDLYYVQVGAFNNEQAAQTFSENFKGSGYNVLVLQPFQTDRKSVYRVRVGGFETRELALAAKDKLAKQTRKSDYFVIRY